MPIKVKYNFSNIILEQNFINNYNIENKNGRVAIFINIKDTIFKQYKYHSYISGEGYGPKLELQMYLVSKDQPFCYKIKSQCYEYETNNELKFIGYYYNMFLKQNEKYNLAIYVPDNERLYITNIEV